MRERVLALDLPITMEGELPSVIAYLYAVTTAELGHYVEYIRLVRRRAAVVCRSTHEPICGWGNLKNIL